MLLPGQIAASMPSRMPCCAGCLAQGRPGSSRGWRCHCRRGRRAVLDQPPGDLAAPESAGTGRSHLARPHRAVALQQLAGRAPGGGGSSTRHANSSTERSPIPISSPSGSARRLFRPQRHRRRRYQGGQVPTLHHRQRCGPDRNFAGQRHFLRGDRERAAGWVMSSSRSRGCRSRR